MQIGTALTQSQTLKLTLTPELKQSLNILKLSSLELVDYLHQQIVENPLLKVNENSKHHTPLFGSYSRPFTEKNKYDPIDHYADTRITLEDHLMEQVLTLENISPNQMKILKFLIGNLNHNGFLEIEPTIAARIFSVPVSEIEQVLQLLQSLDPIGVGARNFTDCLLIQMEAQAQENSLAYSIVEKHLEDLAQKRFQKLARIFNVFVSDIQQAAEYIKTLNPHPCSEFHYETTQYIVPDIIVERIKGQHVININDRIMPEISISQSQTDSIGTPDYWKEKHHEALNLLNCVTTRKQTLYIVTQAILKRQKKFFQIGFYGLKPMTLRDIAEQLGYHESTISRAISDKYIQTPHGLFQLKSLFTKGIHRKDSIETNTPFEIKEKIKEWIKVENKQKPYSDQKLVHLLEKEGILISRRTVAKYREEMGIPGSAKRKDYL